MFEKAGFASDRPECESQLWHILDVCPWANYLISLSLNAFIYKMIVPTPQSDYKQ